MENSIELCDSWEANLSIATVEAIMMHYVVLLFDLPSLPVVVDLRIYERN